ncbi:MAG TPA: hypothetical protein VFU05_16255 [Cyclobacteriaceae bacterium]|nr:hypothetical protein [Cyclobacteriaceae bacterium]
MNESVKLRILSLVFILTMSGMFTFCSDNTTEESTHFVYSADRITKSVQTITGLLQTKVEYSHKQQSLTISASNSFSEMVTITVTNWDFQNPPENGVLEKKYDATYDAELGENQSPYVECIDLTGPNQGTSLCDGAVVTFTMDGELYTSIFIGNEDGTVTISESDPVNKSISGSFDVHVQQSIGKKVKLSGTFTNVKYTVF